MSRPSREVLFMDTAELWAKRGTCMRACVGAVVVYDHRPISIGYNGAPSGAPHCAGNKCPLSEHKTCIRAVHAEINALEFAHSLGAPMQECDLYTTHAPCGNCAEAINRYRIRRVYYRHPYHRAGLAALIMPHFRITTSGTMINELGEAINYETMP